MYIYCIYTFILILFVEVKMVRNQAEVFLAKILSSKSFSPDKSKLRVIFRRNYIIKKKYLFFITDCFVRLITPYKTRFPEGGYRPDIRDVTDEICKLRKSYH